jgi:hypothetical protein
MFLFISESSRRQGHPLLEDHRGPSETGLHPVLLPVSKEKPARRADLGEKLSACEMDPRSAVERIAIDPTAGP